MAFFEMAGWLVQVKSADNRGEHSVDWIVASSNWMTACNIAREAALAEAGEGTWVIHTRAIRQASQAELADMSDSQAKHR